jgi:hypothetical protein
VPSAHYVDEGGLTRHCFVNIAVIGAESTASPTDMQVEDAKDSAPGIIGATNRLF